jgi:hypothetical protein
MRRVQLEHWEFSAAPLQWRHQVNDCIGWRIGRPAYHPSTLLKIYMYGYVNQVQSSRRLEREASATSS